MRGERPSPLRAFAPPACARALFLAALALPVFASLSLPKDPASGRYASSAPPDAAGDKAAPSASGNAAPEAASGVPALAAADREALLALARAGFLDSARAAALKSLSAHPNDAFLLLLLGKLSTSGRESAEYLKKAIRAGGNSPEAEEALFRLGQYTYATGKYPLAIPYFREYLRRYPRGGWKDPASYWMGNACLALARSRADKADYLDSSAAWFSRLLDAARPGDYYRPLALEGLAKAKAGKGDREGAWQAAREALDKAPEEEKPSLLLLAAQTRQGVDRAEEKSLMAQLAERFPQSPEARYLRKLNAGADTAHWKSGSGLPRAPMPPRDSLTAFPTAPGEAKGGDGKTAGASAPRPAPGQGQGDSAGKAKTTAPGSESAEKPYTLQCGAFTQPGNAQAMASALSKLGLSPETLERDRGGKRIYQVRVGRFATPEEAEAFARDRLKPQRILSQPVPVNP